MHRNAGTSHARFCIPAFGFQSLRRATAKWIWSAEQLKIPVPQRKRGGRNTHFAGASAANHVHNLGHGRAADNGVVHQKHGAPLENHRHRVQLAPHAQLPRAAITCRDTCQQHRGHMLAFPETLLISAPNDGILSCSVQPHQCQAAQHVLLHILQSPHSTSLLWSSVSETLDLTMIASARMCCLDKTPVWKTKNKSRYVTPFPWKQQSPTRDQNQHYQRKHMLGTQAAHGAKQETHAQWEKVKRENVSTRMRAVGRALLVRHDEGAADVAVLHEAFSVGQAQLSADLDGCRPRAVRYRHHAVNVPPNLPAHPHHASRSIILAVAYQEYMAWRLLFRQDKTQMISQQDECNLAHTQSVSHPICLHTPTRPLDWSFMLWRTRSVWQHCWRPGFASSKSLCTWIPNPRHVPNLWPCDRPWIQTGSNTAPTLILWVFPSFSLDVWMSSWVLILTIRLRHLISPGWLEKV